MIDARRRFEQDRQRLKAQGRACSYLPPAEADGLADCCATTKKNEPFFQRVRWNVRMFQGVG